MTFRQCYCGSYCLFMIFAVFDLLQLTMCINCSFFYICRIYRLINLKSLPPNMHASLGYCRVLFCVKNCTRKAFWFAHCSRTVSLHMPVGIINPIRWCLNFATDVRVWSRLYYCFVCCWWKWLCLSETVTKDLTYTYLT